MEMLVPEPLSDLSKMIQPIDLRSRTPLVGPCTAGGHL